MKGRKIFAYLLVLVLLTTFLSESGLENVLAADKTVKSGSVAEEEKASGTETNGTEEKQSSEKATNSTKKSGEEVTPDEESANAGEDKTRKDKTREEAVADEPTTSSENNAANEEAVTSSEEAVNAENTENAENKSTSWEKLCEKTDWAKIDTNNKTISVIDPKALTLLSNCPAENYKDYTISKNSSYTGSTMEIPATITHDDTTYNFNGLGTKECPFSGKFQIKAVKIPSALFGGLSSTAVFFKDKEKESLSIIVDSDNWKANSSVLAESYVFQDAENNTDAFQIDVSAAAKNNADKIVTGSLVGEISGTNGTNGTLQPELTYAEGTTVAIKKTKSSDASADNAGLLCNTLLSGTLDVSKVSVPSSYTVITDNGAAGGIVGEMQAGTTLILGNAVISADVTGTTAAGGIIGNSNGATIKVTDSFSIGEKDNPKTIQAEDNAGGWIGKAENTAFTIADGKEIITEQVKVNASGENGNAGGIFGFFSCESEFTFDDKIKMNGAATVEGITTGGLVGVLVNNSADKKISIQGTSGQAFSVTSVLEGQNIGGLIGQYSQKDARASLEISNVNATSSITAKENATYGGLIGLVQNQEVASSAYGYVKMDGAVSNVSVTKNPDKVINYGGIIGATGADGYFLDFGNVTVNAGTYGLDAANANCGGLVGNLESGVLRLHGVTDLGSAKIKSEGTTKGQLVGARNNALIYALGDGSNADENTADKNTGWTLKRSAVVKVSDIGSYGEVYRQGDNLMLEGENGLLKVDDKNHIVTVSKVINAISSAKEFAAIAIRAQLTETGVVKFEKADGTDFDFYNATLSLADDINLIGTGITGFMRDNGTNASNEAFADGNGFKGTLNGAEKTITLSIGEAYGQRGDSKVDTNSEGSGQIYRHKNNGLFAVTAGATISQLKTAGTITVDSSETGKNYCGAVVAQNMSSSLTVTNCSTSVAIAYAGNYAEKSVFYVGGLVGEITADCATEGTLTMTGNTVFGSIELKNPANTAITDACMGGMIGSIYRNEDTKSGKINCLIVSPKTFKLDLSDTTIDGLNMAGKASTSMGGFLGYDWNNVAVTLKNVVVKKSSSLNSSGTANFGGLVYKATGYWNVEKNEANKPGIDIQSAAFKGNSENKDNVDGLLVYCGRHSQESALYLEIKQDAYQIGQGVTVTEKTNTKFDELVGTSLSGNTNGQGVVSLATTDASKDNPKFNQNNTCTTYRNVTKNDDQNWKANGNTRYYYNLDLIREHKPSYTENPGKISDEKQLLTWSVSRYAADNIKEYFGAYNGKGEESVQLKENKTYDLTGYSYYPVSVGSEETLTFDGNGATIQFDNEEFDKKEETKENSTTVMKSGESSQHALMHFGLFRNYIASNPKEIKTYTLTVKNMTLTGSVGQTVTGLTSGALICETVEGAVTNNTTINTHSLSISDITMNNLYVTGHKDSSYAPLLINKIGSYTSVSLNKVKAAYTKNTGMPDFAASSLIGDAGGVKAQNISLSFSSIALQDGAKENKSAMFSRAMLLNSFRYPSGASCAAVYNFDLADDWTDKTWTHHNTTYGNEISESVEYEDEEHWYYDTRKKKTDIYVNETDSGKSGTAENAPKFETYKPYVFENSIKNKSAEYHEIKVNVYVVDILNGCGTYGHPFQIDSADELVAIADYIKTGSAGTGWIIRSCEAFLKDKEEQPHYDNDLENCSEYTYDGIQWISGEKKITNEDMHEYMRNAYYQIVKDITLDSTFCGLGYDNKTAFRGVIVGKAKDNGTYPTITLKNSSLIAEYASHGLINNSYGSVVMNLTVKLSKGDLEPIELNETEKKEATVNNYYGSVMGQILGGDNFIDNVKVEFDEDVMNLTGNYSHLIPVGGYVGIAQGGSLIFRNMESASGLTDKKIKVNNSEYDPATDEGKYFYINPYVGRVLDGCAFYENTDQSKKLDNTNKNYQIATIDPGNEKKIQTTIEKKDKQYFLNTEFSDAQSLLILSAIINSGAAGGGKISKDVADYGSFAYYSGESVSLFGNKNYGKARNASYTYVGSNREEAEKDFKTSIVDDHKLVTYDDKASKIVENSNVPYLVTKYTNSSGLTYFCSARDTRVSLKFTEQDKTIDMGQYQSGYRGIAGRYKSASIQTTPEKYNADRNTPFISSFDGKGMNLLLDMSVKEYSDDNYHAIGVGGFFNILQQDNNDSTKNITNELKNISITGTIGLSYHNKDGQQVDTNDAFSVGVGALAGRSANRSRDGEYYYADVKNVTLENLQVSAPYNAGGIFGLGGVNSYAVDGLRHSNVATNVFAAHYLSCKLNDVTIVSEKNAGALLGWGAANAKDTNDTSTSSQNNNPTYSVDSCHAANVTVKSREEKSCPEAAAVFIGKCDGSLTVTSSSVTNSSVKANYAGMVSGQIRANSSRKFSATDTNITGITGENSDNSILEATACAGGLVGYSGVESNIERCTISNTSITAKIEGGLVGEVTQKSDIYGCKVSGVNFSNPSDSTGTLAGALLGKLSAELTGGNLLWDTNTYKDGITTKGTWLGSLENKENNKIQLAGVSRKGMQKSTSLSDVGSGKYDGYISYADYTVKNESAPLPDYTVNNPYPEAIFDTKKSLTLVRGEFIYLGEGKWTIDADSESYVQIDNKNLLTAKEVGTAKITKENVTYTINVVESLVGTKTLLQNGTYNSKREVEYNGSSLTNWSIINGYFSSSGSWGLAGANASSVLKIPMEDGYTYKITYGEKNDGSKNYPWGRMRLRVGENETSAGDGKKENGWMSNKDKDANTANAKKTYTIYNENEVEIPGRKNQSIFLNYDNSNDNSEESPGYQFNTPEDRALFKSITVTRTSKISERSGYDSLKLISMPKLTFTNGEEIDKSQMKFVLYESVTGIMRAVDSSEVALSTSKVTAENPKITASYNGQSYEIVVKVMPYGENDPVKVVYSPAGQYQNKELFSGDFGTLYGDAVYNYDSSGTVKNNVDLICQEKEAGKVEENSGRVLYTTTGVKNFDSSHKMSTYQIQQKKIEQTKTAGFSSDFRVLLVSGSSAQSDIEQYLNLLTNGGYSKAVSQAGVTANSETYQWDGSTFKDTKTSSLTVSNSGKTSLSYALGRSYDNGNDQFTLLTVTFTSGTHTQVVYVPIIVRRIVEVNFKATLNEESIFRDKAYDDLTEHVLVEYGSNMTGYLTWTYNKSGKETTEYDWQSYMESGADLTRGFEKTIIFDCSDGYLPAGARITLIDTQNQDHTYYYTVTEKDKTDKKVEIALSAFCDASGKAYTNTAVSKLYDATAKEDAAGRFVEAESAEQATVAVSTSDGTKYYRLKKEEDKEKPTFTIKLNNKKAVEENFYMVVNVPEESAEISNISSINGAVNSNVTTSAPCSITKVRRVDESGDSGNNTESTFSILSSYTQNLVDQSKDGVLLLNDTNKTVNISLLDTITFDKSQAYGAEDKLYQDFMITPYNNEQALTFLQDSGTKGTVSFEVYTMEDNKKRYYTYESGELKAATAQVKCASYEWTSQEGRMNLVLGTRNSKDAAIDLSKVRTGIMQAGGDPKIYVQLTMRLTLSDSSYNELVPASSLDSSNNQPKNSLRLDYVSRLAKSADNLSESTWRGSYNGSSRYYKAESGCLNLNFEGDDIRQLGINLNDLSNNKPQVIDATASIDFNKWSGWKEAMEETEKITFTFHLEQKDNEKEYKKVSIKDYLDYMKVGIWNQKDYEYEEGSIQKDDQSNSWSFTQTKANGEFANLKDGIFSLPVEYAVKISADQKDFQYANYRLVVKVSMYDKSNNPLSIPNNPDNPIETVPSLSDYMTYTVARVLQSF